MSERRIDYFYDVKCPFAWYGFETLCRYRKKWNIDIEFHPFSLDIVREETKNPWSPPSPAKDKYVIKDILRLAKHFNVPVKLPEDVGILIKRSTMNAMRTLTLVKERRGDVLEEASRQLWLAFLSRHEDLTDEVIMKALETAGIAAVDALDIVSTSKGDEVKEKLRKSIQTVIDHGGFGAPTILTHVDGQIELVFGSDRMFLVAEFLGETYEGPLAHMADW